MMAVRKGLPVHINIRGQDETLVVIVGIKTNSNQVIGGQRFGKGRLAHPSRRSILQVMELN